MNIREVEWHTGLERANVRFYEKEGLLSPERSKNGYRNYSEADVETLLRIKLLRQLKVSVEEIRQLQTDEVALQEVIAHRLAALRQERADLAREQKICETIQNDGVSYGQLHARRYLDQLQTLKRMDWGLDTGTAQIDLTSHLKTDVLPPDLRPGQRMFARVLDGLLYLLLWLFLFYIVCGFPFTWSAHILFVHWFFSFLLWILLEPTLLAYLGTTVGKCIIGMRVHTDDGEKLDWWQAWARMWKMFWKSSCMFSTRYWHRISYGDYWPYNKENGFPWDEETTYSFRDEKSWRLPLVIACIVVLLLMPNVIITESKKMENQGPMTVAEFAENYNKYVSIEGGWDEYSLNEQGQWEKVSYGVAHIYMDNGEGSHETRFPQFVYTEEDGYLTGISFEIYREGDEEQLITTGKGTMIPVTIAFAAAQAKHQNSAVVAAEIEQHHMEDYSFQVGDLMISWEVDISGYSYNEAMGALVPTGYNFEKPYFYHLRFEIKPTAQAKQE